MDLARKRHGNALILVLGIALLLAIQIYIIQTMTVGSFRHVEKVNALIRAIYVGEAAFSQILAKIKVDKWENRWFKGMADGVREYGQPLAGGTFSSVVVDVAVTPGSTDKLADVWIEARYDGSTQLMYYRVLYADDTLDFTAQVYPRFFTFLEANDPNPFTGALAPATAHIQNLINQQTNNEAAAIAAINGVRTTCNLAGVTASLGVAIPGGGTPLDTLAPPGGAPVDLCTYVNGTISTLVAIPPPPAPPPAPTVPPAPPVGADFIAAVRATFDSHGYGPLPGKSGKVSTSPAAPLMDDTKAADEQWKVEHHKKNYEHYMKDEEMLGFIGNLIDKRDSAPASLAAVAINGIIADLFAYISSKSTAAGGRVYAAPTGTKAQIISEFRASRSELPPIIPSFRENEEDD